MNYYNYNENPNQNLYNHTNNKQLENKKRNKQTYLDGCDDIFFENDYNRDYNSRNGSINIGHLNDETKMTLFKMNYDFERKEDEKQNKISTIIGAIVIAFCIVCFIGVIFAGVNARNRREEYREELAQNNPEPMTKPTNKPEEGYGSSTNEEIAEITPIEQLPANIIESMNNSILVENQETGMYDLVDAQFGFKIPLDYDFERIPNEQTSTAIINYNGTKLGYAVDVFYYSYNGGECRITYHIPQKNYYNEKISIEDIVLSYDVVKHQYDEYEVKEEMLGNEPLTCINITNNSYGEITKCKRFFKQYGNILLEIEITYIDDELTNHIINNFEFNENRLSNEDLIIYVCYELTEFYRVNNSNTKNY